MLVDDYIFDRVVKILLRDKIIIKKAIFSFEFPIDKLFRLPEWVKIEVAHPTGIEPVTFGFGNQRSIQLSYGCFYSRFIAKSCSVISPCRIIYTVCGSLPCLLLL